MKRKVMWLAIAAVAAAMVFWFYYALRSYAVMAVYSAQQRADSVMQKNGFDITMPAAGGWYPMIVTYNADGFPGWSGIEAQMSILYTFGAFDAGTRVSSIYDPGSDKYSAFYGAYAVREHGGVFGFKEDKSVDMDEIEAAVAYDETQLVIGAFGCPSPVFEAGDYAVQADVELAGSGGWTRIDAAMTVSGAAHRFAGHKTPYLQYGPPVRAPEQDFAPASMTGRIYAKYFEEYDCTVMVYCIAPSAAAVDACDAAALRKTRITALD